jgi:hypothetical protein
LAVVVLLAAFGIPFVALGAQGTGAAKGAPKVNRFIGAQKCKTCHTDKAAGDQYTAWTNMKHAKAWERLASDEAKKVGKEKGIEDPQKSEKCLACHVTGFGQPKEHFDKAFDVKLGVQCETCHGPGERHMKARIAAAGDEEEDAKPKYTAIPADEIVVTPKMEVCLACHNEESPSFRPFCFHRANAEVRHLNPLKPRTPEELAKILACGEGEKCTCKHGDDGCKCGVPDPKVNKK